MAASGKLRNFGHVLKLLYIDLTERVSFVLGEAFFTFPALEEKLRLYQQQNFAQLWIRDSRTVNAAKKCQ